MLNLQVYKNLVLFVLFSLAGIKVNAQQAAVNFHKLGFAEGLHDGIIKCISQDRYGYVWIGSVGALNRFDGRKITQFTYLSGDTTSPYSTQPRCMHSDLAGRFWIGTETGLMEYDFRKGNFRRIPAFRDHFILSIESISDSILLVGTRRGLIRYNTIGNKIFDYSTSLRPEHAAFRTKIVNNICKRGQLVYLATNLGLIIMDPEKQEAREVDIPEIKSLPIIAISADKAGNIWISCQFHIKLARLSADLTRLTVMDNYFTAGINNTNPEIISLLTDKQDRVWILTTGDGLMQFHPSSNMVTRYLHNVHFPSGPSSNSYRCIFQDASDIIWLGCYVDGVNYFEPDQNLFSTILPFPVEKHAQLGKLGRAVAVDKNGNIWMGNHDGLSRYDRKTSKYTVWRNDETGKNVLYSNIIRSLLCDDENNIWIGSANGVNFYNAATGEIDFIDRQQLPLSFYNSINKDRSGNIWFCTNDSASLYWYSCIDKTFHNISEHPQLKKYTGFTPTSYVMEDGRQRLWISFSRKGIVMLDKKTGLTKQYVASESGREGIIGNQVIDIKEDKDGRIWASTFNGITGIDVEQDKFISFNNRNGLPGNMTAPLVIDSTNRIWVGVNGGLTMLSSDRKHLTTFSLSDGLSSVGFPEHAGITAPNGDVIMPTYTGYTSFNPANFTERKTKFNFYLSGSSIFDKEYYRVNEAEDDPALTLRPQQSSFSFHLAALNYSNPSQTWFAYKLDGFEKDWHFTRDPKAVYTNVPGGRYIFLYKAAADNNSWDKVAAKRLTVNLATIFYKTTWFRILLACVLAVALYALYHYRTRQQEQLYQLKGKAQLLEKEKALVMYESLKQQLNPHFLFNSLTSLNSLIEAEPKAASEFLDGLSKTYRYILKSRDNETVPLVDEVRFAENYIKLQKTRFERGFDVTISIPDDFNHRKIVPVTLQNLIENAIKHNIIDEESPLVVQIYIEDGLLVVENNLQKKKFVETSNQQGLSNMQSLYKYLSDRPVEIIEIHDSFKIKLPLL
ncbi:MAG TPA: two-component regulator propeller domain-containing protein [Chitinophagaceae bacterium]